MKLCHLDEQKTLFKMLPCLEKCVFHVDCWTVLVRVTGEPIVIELVEEFLEMHADSMGARREIAVTLSKGTQDRHFHQFEQIAQSIRAKFPTGNHKESNEPELLEHVFRERKRLLSIETTRSSTYDYPGGQKIFSSLFQFCLI